MECGARVSDELAGVFSEKSPECGEKKRFRCECAYDGTDFCGWQSQKGGGSVQDFIEDRLLKILKTPVRIHGSGRTDAGVHASGQVFHFDAVWNHSDAAMLAALRSTNRTDIMIKSLRRVGTDFHARYGAKGKRYVYYICTTTAVPNLARYRWSLGGRRIDAEKMRAAAAVLLGTHDFTAFSATRNVGAKENPVKTLRRLDVVKRGTEIRIVAEGSGFMYKMVRMLTGALVAVGMGRLTSGDIKRILDGKTRGNFFQTAPAQGLFLKRVFYK